MSGLMLETLIGGVLVVLAVLSLWGRDLFESIVLFIVFGLLLTLLWAKLGVVDVALAEAAIGAGLTGALLLAAGDSPAAHDPPEETRQAPAALPIAVAVAVVGAGLGLALQLSGVSPGSGLTERVAAALPRSGVESSVTAVLLNFRSYDTLLEVAVLVAAWLAALGPPMRGAQPASAGEVVAMLGRLWVPLVALVAAYLVWAGTHWAGGAFQGAAVLAGGAILLWLVGVPGPGAGVRLPVLGLAVFGLVAALGLLASGELLAYPAGAAKTLILVIELVLALSLAGAIVLLYRAVFPDTRPR